MVIEQELTSDQIEPVKHGSEPAWVCILEFSADDSCSHRLQCNDVTLTYTALQHACDPEHGALCVCVCVCVCVHSEIRLHEHAFPLSVCMHMHANMCVFAAFRVTQLCVSPSGAFGRLSER